MPSTKQGGGHTLTFSKKNKDVREILDKYKKEAKETGKSFVANDYICEAIRFYEKNKKRLSGDNADIYIDIEKLVEEKVKEIFNESENYRSVKNSNLSLLETKLTDEDIEED